MFNHQELFIASEAEYIKNLSSLAKYHIQKENLTLTVNQQQITIHYTYLRNTLDLRKKNTIIMLPGLNLGSLAQYYGNVPDLIQHHDILLIDPPGAGGSSKVNYQLYSPYEYVGIIRDTIRALVLPDTSLTLLGHSWTGMLIVNLALENLAVKSDARFNISGLILVNPMGFSQAGYLEKVVSNWKFFRHTLERRKFPPTPAGMKDFLNDGVLDQSVISKVLAENYAYSILNDEEAEALGYYRSHPFELIKALCSRIHESYLISEKLLQLNIPVIMLVGTHDPKCPISTINELIAPYENITLSIFEHAKHVPNLEMPTLFNHIVIQFINKIQLIDNPMPRDTMGTLKL